MRHGEVGRFAGYKGDSRLVDRRAMRQEASRLSSIANKRIKRLENAGLQSSPAYQKYIAEGGKKFGVRGKDYNEVQAELARLRQFLNSKTSTIRGVNANLREMAANTGIKYRNLAELRSKADRFFELSSKVEQYLRNVEDMASAIGYQKIWEAVNQYVQEAGIDLSEGDAKIDEMAGIIGDALAGMEDGSIKNFNDEFWFLMP